MKTTYLVTGIMAICCLQMYMNVHSACGVRASRMVEVRPADHKAAASTTYRKFNEETYRYLVPQWRTRRGATEYDIHVPNAILEKNGQYMLMLANPRSYDPTITVGNTKARRLANVVVRTGFANMIAHGMAAGDRIPSPNIPASVRFHCCESVELRGDNRYFNAPRTYVNIDGPGARVLIPNQDAMFGTDMVVGAELTLGENDTDVAVDIRSTGTVDVKSSGSMVIAANTVYTVSPGHALRLWGGRHGHSACCCW
ncbi:MAG: hypothetical protein LBR78_00545 [Holosporales bacterium]|jgi:hypothetical protein|nr:hypothetical protein [Holosporales bacterium]